MATASADVRCDASGSIVMITPLTAEGRDWMEENLPSEPWQWYAGGLAVEMRYADDIVIGMRDDGLSVSTANFYVA